MSLFDSILHNLKKKIDAEHAYKDVVIECVASILHISLSKDGITLKSGVLYIQTAPPAKMAILLKKEALIEALQEKQIKVSVIK